MGTQIKNNFICSRRLSLTAYALLASGVCIQPLMAESAQNDVKAEVVQQNNITVEGMVKDWAGIPVIGANIIEKGTTNGTITNEQGEFKLRVKRGSSLEISYLGYVTRTIIVNDTKKLNITMSDDSKLLEETVIIGYGTQKKGDTQKSLGYVHINIENPIYAENYTIRLKGATTVKDAFGQITEVAGNAANELDRRARNGKHNLRIVEIDFLESVE